MWLQFDRRCEKIVPKISPKMYFHGDNVNDDVTGWPQNRPSTFLYKWRTNMCRYNGKTSKDSIIKLSVYMCNGTVNMPVWISMDYVIDDVTVYCSILQYTAVCTLPWQYICSGVSHGTQEIYSSVSSLHATGLVCSTSLMASLIRSVGGLSKYFYQGLWLADLNADVVGQSINRRGVA